jgi:hypothetical protein
LAQFVQQPRVLDCDDGLTREILHQRNLLIVKRAYFLPEKTSAPIISLSLSIGTARTVR